MSRRLVVLATSFPRREGDHAGRFVRDLSRGLIERGHEIHHLVPEAPGAPASERLPEGATVERFPFASAAWQRELVYGRGIGANLERRPWLVAAVPRLVRAMERALEAALEARPDAAILSHWVYPAGLVGARLSRRMGRRHVSVAHGGGLQLLANWPILRRRLAPWARGTDGALFVSEDLRARARAALPARLALPPSLVAPMGVDLDLFAPRGDRAATRRRLGVSEEAFLVAAAGRLVRLKGFDLAIEALRETSPGAVLVVAGRGPEEARLRRLAAKRGVEARLVGHLDPPELRALMESADLLVAPSRPGRRGRTEGAPVAVAEALAVGTPVVAARSGGIPDLVREGENGRLFAPDDASGFGRILAALRAAPQELERLRRGCAASRPERGYDRAAAAVETLLAGR
ncbi:MAG: glycosyltransferase [Planctomycetota bacterium]